MSSNSSVAVCPYCASTHIIRKGFRYNKSGSVQLYLCKDCKRSFGENARKVKQLPNDVAEDYLLHVKSLKSMIEIKRSEFPKTTLHRKIRKLAQSCPSWEEQLKARKERNIWGSIMGIDTTVLKVKGAMFIYIHVVDVASSDPLAYDLCEKEDAATVEPILRRLKDLGYEPKVVVSDLAPELLTAVKRVFPDAGIQGCVYHLIRLLDRELPTRKRVKGVDREKAKLWRNVKFLIRCAALAKNGQVRQRYVEQLRHLNADEKAKSVVQRFLNNIKFYHTLDEFKEYDSNVLPRILYNNVCERHIGLVKDLQRNMKGFKNVEAAHGYINFFWFIEKRNGMVFHGKKKDLAFKVPMLLFHDYANLAELSEASGTPREVLNKVALKSGRIVAGDHALTKEELKVIENRMLRTRKTSLAKVMERLGYDQLATVELLKRLGFKVLYNSLDPSKILVYRTGSRMEQSELPSLLSKVEDTNGTV